MYTLRTEHILGVIQMIVNTERFELAALDARQMRMWLEDISALEKSLTAHIRPKRWRATYCELLRGKKS